ncbi:ImmA/IrrE family metallo-endopeptidase [Helicobacter sp. T3_23-1059]
MIILYRIYATLDTIFNQAIYIKSIFSKKLEGFMGAGQTIRINTKRLQYLLDLFGMDESRLKSIIESELKKPLDLSKPINKGTLAEIDTIFNRGLDFYTNPNPINKANSSILFRKENISDDLDIGDVQLITKCEEQMHYISGLAKISDFAFTQRTLPNFSLQVSPQEVAKKMQILLPTKQNLSDKQFLESFIKNLAEHNILVLENIETHNKKYKSNLCGFFIKPNIIALKNQGRKREIFTLAHELGHYLLENENIDKDIFIQNPQNEEKWCNQFAFYLLIGEKLSTLESLQKDEINIENKIIKNISAQKHISRLALFYQHLSIKNITWQDYSLLKEELEQKYREKKQAQSTNNDNNKKGGFASQPPIISPLQKDIFVNAFLEGVVDEYTLRTRFKNYIKNDNLESFIYG